MQVLVRRQHATEYLQEELQRELIQEVHLQSHRKATNQCNLQHYSCTLTSGVQNVHLSPALKPKLHANFVTFICHKSDVFLECGRSGLAQLVMPLVASTTPGPVSTWMGDRLQAGKQSWYATNHQSQLSLAIPSWVSGES